MTFSNWSPIQNLTLSKICAEKHEIKGQPLKRRKFLSISDDHPNDGKMGPLRRDFKENELVRRKKSDIARIRRRRRDNVILRTVDEAKQCRHMWKDRQGKRWVRYRCDIKNTKIRPDRMGTGVFVKDRCVKCKYWTPVKITWPKLEDFKPKRPTNKERMVTINALLDRHKILNSMQVCRLINGYEKDEFKRCYYTFKQKPKGCANTGCKNREFGGCTWDRRRILYTCQRLASLDPTVKTTKLRFWDSGGIGSDVFRFFYKDAELFQREILDKAPKPAAKVRRPEPISAPGVVQ